MMFFLVMDMDDPSRVSNGGVVAFAMTFTVLSMIVCLAPLFRHGWKSRVDIWFAKLLQSIAICCGRSTKSGAAGTAQCFVVCCGKVQDMLETDEQNKNNNKGELSPSFNGM